MKLSPSAFLPGCTQAATLSCVPFSPNAWVRSFGNQLISSDTLGLYFEGEFIASFENSASGFYSMRSFSHANLSESVRRFLFLGESILILRNSLIPALT